MYKIAIIGDRDSVLGYKAIGFDVFVETSFQKASKLLNDLALQDYAVIFIIEDLYGKMKTATDKYMYSDLPAIIPLPGKKGADGSGMAAIKRAVERAIGADIAN
ncbi:MAG: V-type ATP synthase subunit F [Clostridiales bacterium]|nr:MAG: V-type ATP synthase subunit F [Clostridiales bacterium]